MRTGRSGEPRWAARHNAAGVTLVELLVTVFVVAILAAAALPSFREFIVSQRVKTASFDLMSMLTLARSEAIKRNNNATLSGVGSGAPTVTAGGVTIRQHEPFTNLTLTCKSGGMQVACTDVTYLGSGRLAAATPSIEISSPPSDQWSCITIDPSGRPASKQGSC